MAENGVKATMKGKRIVIELEIGEGRPSSTGKSLVVATTSGYMPIDGAQNGERLSLTVIKPNK